MVRKIWIMLLGLTCFAFTGDLQKRIVRERDFTIECYISMKEVANYEPLKTYYWYKSGQIHRLENDTGGPVLHAEYMKYNKANQVVEKGKFDYGLKTGTWKTWFDNGNLQSCYRWKNGFKQGDFCLLDSLGNLQQTGTYKKNLRSGTWIDHRTKDTTYYKRDQPLKEKPKRFYERIFKKRDSAKKLQ